MSKYLLTWEYIDTGEAGSMEYDDLDEAEDDFFMGIAEAAQRGDAYAFTQYLYHGTRCIRSYDAEGGMR